MMDMVNEMSSSIANLAEEFQSLRKRLYKSERETRKAMKGAPPPHHGDERRADAKQIDALLKPLSSKETESDANAQDEGCIWLAEIAQDFALDEQKSLAITQQLATWLTTSVLVVCQNILNFGLHLRQTIRFQKSFQQVLK